MSRVDIDLTVLGDFQFFTNAISKPKYSALSLI